MAKKIKTKEIGSVFAETIISETTLNELNEISKEYYDRKREKLKTWKEIKELYLNENL
jgi:hypothetical protein